MNPQQILAEIATIKRYVATLRDEKTGEIKDEYVVRDRDLQDLLNKF